MPTTPKPPKAIVISPRPAALELRDLVRRFSTEAKARGLSISSIASEETSEVSDENWVKPIRLVKPSDAANIYRLIHHGPTVVVVFTRVFVRRDPSSTPLTRKQALPLDQFVANKADYGLINGRSDITRCLDQFDSWRVAIGCEGQDDPRVLPLHSFLAPGDWVDLSRREERVLFEQTHGTGGLRTDAADRPWQRAHAPHGRQILRVAGVSLPEGMHWDVSSPRRKGTVYCAGEIWAIPRRGYVNVYPDGHVRGGKGNGGSRCVWPNGR